MAAIAHSLFHIDYKTEPYWWEEAKPDDSLSTNPPADTELLIVGGGHGDLSAVLDLARANCFVTVVYTGSLGTAASSRNGGNISAGINLGKGIAGGQGQIKQSWVKHSSKNAWQLMITLSI